MTIAIFYINDCENTQKCIQLFSSHSNTFISYIKQTTMTRNKYSEIQFEKHYLVFI